MATTPYATLTDLSAYLGKDGPAESGRLLARAQELVDTALNSSSFAVDTNGNPTDATTIAAFKEAVCAQVEWWIANGDEFDQQLQYASFSIEGISATRSPGVRSRLCERAWDALTSVAATSTFGRALVPGKPVI